MLYPSALIDGTLLSRYKRFLVDVRLATGEIVTAHTPNTGAMLGCSAPGSPVRLSRSDDPRRKLALTLEQVQDGGVWIGARPSLANDLVDEALAGGGIPALAELPHRRREVPYGRGSRVDLLLWSDRGPRLYLEVKSASLARGRLSLFPDAVSTRGRRHLEDLSAVVAAGERAAMVYVAQRGDVDCLEPADDIDPAYGAALRAAAAAGVELYAFRCAVDATGITLAEAIAVQLPPR